MHHVKGVCCIVCVIDGMLFEFCMNFNFFNISCFLHVLCYFQHLKKKFGVNKIPGGGGGSVHFFLLYHFISRFILFSTLKKKFEILKSAPSHTG